MFEIRRPTNWQWMTDDKGDGDYDATFKLISLTEAKFNALWLEQKRVHCQSKWKAWWRMRGMEVTDKDTHLKFDQKPDQRSKSSLGNMQQE